ncbi:MAG: F0F1 ATP synthase subunit alpha, partial [bacterium]|nr:F0F1 ATP synthase subunit alpha [bacterium]
AFVQFSQELDETTRKKIEHGSRLMEILKQNQYSVLPMEEQVCVLFAATSGLVDTIPLEKVREFEAKLLLQLRNIHQDILKTIRETKDFDEKTQEKLQKVVEELHHDFQTTT